MYLAGISKTSTFVYQMQEYGEEKNISNYLTLLLDFVLILWEGK